MRKFLKDLWAAFVEARKMKIEHYTNNRTGS